MIGFICREGTFRSAMVDLKLKIMISRGSILFEILPWKHVAQPFHAR